VSRHHRRFPLVGANLRRCADRPRPTAATTIRLPIIHPASYRHSVTVSEKPPYFSFPSTVILRTVALTLNRTRSNLTKRLGAVSRISQSSGEIMTYKREDFETLRLLRAFSKIQDPAKRREILDLVEKAASSKSE